MLEQEPSAEARLNSLESELFELTRALKALALKQLESLESGDYLYRQWAEITTL